MASKRIYQVAKDYKISSEALLKILRELRFEPKSHMSVATDDMVAAVQRKFDIEKENAKKDMDQRKKSERLRARTEALKRKHSGGGVTTEKSSASKDSTQFLDLEEQHVQSTPKPAVAPRARTGPPGSKQFGPPGRGGQGPRRRKDKRKRGRSVDRAEVSKSFRSTMAQIGSSQKTKKYRRRGASEGELIEVENIVEVTEYLSVGELAKILEVKAADLIGKMLQLGQMATINQRLDIDTIEMLALEYGFGIQQEAEVGDFAKQEESAGNQTKRCPVVTVMGHVDHGKTSLLDYIRKTDVVSAESGAITQHIGAYQVTAPNGEKVTFLDTPGHEAFTAMRARGAQVTDIVILVVAADDGVMPQTIEAIDHAKAAKAPIVVAINKIDKPDANPDRIKQELTSHGLVAEEWGGDVVMAPVSAKTGEGIEKLLEMVVLTADLLDLKADATIRAQGAVIEAKLEKGRGPVATVLITTGSLSVGESIVAGANSGRVRKIVDDRTQSLKRLGPGDPGQITGLNGVPQAGDSFLAVGSDTEAREISSKREQIKREYEFRRPKGHMSLENVFDRIQEGQVKELSVVLKGDVDGSIEALADKMLSIKHEEVRVKIVHKGVGAITESDVLLAAASEAIIIGFHVNPTPRAREIALREKVDIRTYEIIYEVEQDVTNALEGMLTPTLEEKFAGIAEVRETFRAPKVGLIAGCYIKEGTVRRDNQVKLIREGRTVYTGAIDSLRRFKDDVREVQTGYECGIHIENFNDVKVGDSIEAFETVQVARKLQER